MLDAQDRAVLNRYTEDAVSKLRDLLLSARECNDAWYTVKELAEMSGLKASNIWTSLYKVGARYPDCRLLTRKRGKISEYQVTRVEADALRRAKEYQRRMSGDERK